MKRKRQHYNEEEKECTNEAWYPPNRTVIYIEGGVGSLGPSKHTLRV